MVNEETFNIVRDKFKYQGSWAIWGNFGERPKDNMDDLTIFANENLKNTLKQLHLNYVLVGLNISTSAIVEPLSNFHGKNGDVFKLRYAISETKLWGSYMTDILKDFPEPQSNLVARKLRSDEGVHIENKNIETFNEELNLIGAENAKLVALGDLVYNILIRNYDSNRIIKIPHYASRVNKEKYYELVHNALN
jgi:hypothetical protein